MEPPTENERAMSMARARLQMAIRQLQEALDVACGSKPLDTDDDPYSQAYIITRVLRVSHMMDAMKQDPDGVGFGAATQFPS